MSRKLEKLPFLWYFNTKLTWTDISTYYQLSEDFIEKYYNKLDIHFILENQKLSEYFLNMIFKSHKYAYYSLSKFTYNLEKNTNIPRKIRKKFAWNLQIKTKRLFFRQKYLLI